MEQYSIIIVLIAVVGVAGFAAIAYSLLGSGAATQTDIRDLMVSTARTNRPGRQSKVDPYELDVDTIKKSSTRKDVKSSTEDIPRKLFRAGFFTANDQKFFAKVRLFSFVLGSALVPIGLYTISGNMMLTLAGVMLGVLIGYSIPISWLERKIRQREEDIMYFLPLVIEQVSIGVSSALDVGPCISHIVTMASERDSHNPVTEMFLHVEKLIRSGLNLEDALVEVGDANGMTEVKHAFMFLAQVSRHGGEVSKQLQELADSVMVQRQVQIEGKITALPVKATGPLATVFAGFFALLFAGLLVRLLSAFGG